MVTGSHFNVIVVLIVDCWSNIPFIFGLSAKQKYFVGQQGKNKKTCSEVPEVKKRKNTSSEQSTDAYRRLDSNNQSDVKKPSGLKVGAQPSIYVTPAYLFKKY